MSSDAEQIKAIIAGELHHIIELRHDLHAHPQISFQETHAVEVICRELSEAGIEFQTGVGVTGVVGWLWPDDPKKRDLPAIALRADMDALPITEQTGLEYASKYPGVMHACGHDGHVAMLIGTARVLAKLTKFLPRPIKFFFQPAEEGDGGAEKMIADGAMDATIGGCDVSAVFAMHGLPTFSLGQLAVRTGPCMAGVTGFKIIVQGKGTHGATPHLGRNPITAGAKIVSALQNIIADLPDKNPAVLSICSFNAGSASNIIPDSAELSGTIRAFSDETAELIFAKIGEISSNIALDMKCETTLLSIYSYPVTTNAPQATALMRAVGQKVLGADNVPEAPLQTIAEDFSYFTQRVPSCLAFLGLCPPNEKTCTPLHNPKFDFDDRAIPIGTEIFCRLALGSDLENLPIR